MNTLILLNGGTMNNIDADLFDEQLQQLINTFFETRSERTMTTTDWLVEFADFMYDECGSIVKVEDEDESDSC